MSDPDTLPTRAPSSLERWWVGTSAVAAEVAIGGGPVGITALFGSIDPRRPTAPGARHVVEQVWMTLIDDVLYSAHEEVLRGAAEVADDALRRQFSPSDLDGRGTVSVAVLDHGEASIGGTAEAAAFLVRKGVLVDHWLASAAGADHPSGQIHPFAGGRPSDASHLEPALMQPPWVLDEGDRVVLATRDLRDWFPTLELAALAAAGDPESAAQTLAAVAGVRGEGIEIAVSVSEWGIQAHKPRDTQLADEEWSDVLGALEGLEDHFTDPGLADVDLTAADLDDDGQPTAGFAPVRERRSHGGEAVLSLTPAEAPDPSELEEAGALLEPAAPATEEPHLPERTEAKGAAPAADLDAHEASQTPDSVADRTVAGTPTTLGAAPGASLPPTPAPATKAPVALLVVAGVLAVAVVALGWLVWQGAT